MVLSITQASSVLCIVLGLAVFVLLNSSLLDWRLARGWEKELECNGNKMHVLVTGGAGFIGSHAARRLLEAGHCVTVVDDYSRGNPGAIDILSHAAPSRFRFAQADLGNDKQLDAVFSRAHPSVDLVMHFAAVSYVGESVKEPMRYYRNITTNTAVLLDAMAKAGVNKLVYSSTCAVYGNPTKLPVTEDTPVAPVSPYGRAKVYAEQEVNDFAVAHPEFKAILLRYFNVYGSDPQGLLGEWPRLELRRKHPRISNACMDAGMGLLPELAILGTKHPTADGTTIRDYIHVEDLVGAHLLAMKHLASPPPVFNIGTGKGTSAREFVAACKRATGKDIKVVEHKDGRPGDSAAVYADTSKITRVMGWRANYTNVEDGLRHAWNWRLKNPEGYS